MTHQQNSISAFIPDSFPNRGGLQLKWFQLQTHNLKVLVPNSDQDQSPPFALFQSGYAMVFPGCKANAGIVTLRGP